MADATTTTTTTGAAEEPDATAALSKSSEAALARLEQELGDAIIEHGGAGSEHAAPVAMRVVREWQKLKEKRLADKAPADKEPADKEPGRGRP